MAHSLSAKKSDRILGIIGTILFLIALIYLLFFLNIQQADPPFPEEETIMYVDIELEETEEEMGGGSSGGW